MVAIGHGNHSNYTTIAGLVILIFRLGPVVATVVKIFAFCMVHGSGLSFHTRKISEICRRTYKFSSAACYVCISHDVITSQNIGAQDSYY